MGLITPDFSEAVGFDAVPPGVYNVRVGGYEQKTSQKGDAYLSWKLMIFGAEGDFAAANNRTLFLTTMLKGKGAGILKSLLQAAIPDYQPGQAFDPDAIVGAELKVTAQKNIKPDGSEGSPNVANIKPLN